MRRIGIKLLLPVLALIAGLHSPAYSKLQVSGSFRNDAVVNFTTNGQNFNNLMETKILLKRKATDWKFYSDFRLKMMSGQYANEIDAIEEDFTEMMAMFFTNASVLSSTGGIIGDYFVTIPRVYLKFYTGIGDFSVGKTYINFGNPSIFNPLEMEKSINFSDLSYEKEGIIATEWRFPFGALSGGTIYLAPDDPLSNTAGGFSVFGNVGSFDIGMVGNRKSYNENVLGFYFKGDLGVGIQAGYALHCDDWFSNVINEANIGIDYSFFDGKLIPSLEFYYAESGATETNDYDYSSTDDRYFLARYYLYANLTYAPDEFLNLAVDCFINLIDYSGMLMPKASYILKDGLTLSGQLGYLWKKGYAEFSGDNLGPVNLTFRVEAAL